MKKSIFVLFVFMIAVISSPLLAGDEVVHNQAFDLTSEGDTKLVTFGDSPVRQFEVRPVGGNVNINYDSTTVGDSDYLVKQNEEPYTVNFRNHTGVVLDLSIRNDSTGTTTVYVIGRNW